MDTPAGAACQSNDWTEFLQHNRGQPLVARDHANRVYFSVELANYDPLKLQKERPDWTYEQPLGNGPLANEFLFSAPKNQAVDIELLDDHGHFLGKDSILERRQVDLEKRAHQLNLLKRTHGIKGVQVHNVRQMHKRVPLNNNKRKIDGPVDSALLVVEQAKKDLNISDPIFDRQWHLINPLQPGNDLNIVELWKQGIRGNNVSVAVVDDGLDFNHPDLKDNYFAAGSWDFNDNSPDPLPRLSDDTHGTRCCGEIAAGRNDVCGIGVAYESKIAGIRILSGPIIEADEALALNYAMDKNDIYSCSWGPPDDGRSMAEPGRVVRKAMINGVQNGRDKRGNIFVFASGNGAAYQDNCNFDGYTNSIYSITISAIDRKGLHPYYAESCSANMAVTYSSNTADKIHTTDVGDALCTDAHGGTSAAAPLAAGVYALVLQVRPELTWRDMQYLTVDAAVTVDEHESDLQQTAIGKKYSHRYGYGKLDSQKLVERAKTIDLVKPQTWFFSDIMTVNKPITALPDANEDRKSNPTDEIKGAIESTIQITKEDLENMQNVEHVNVMLNLGSQVRGTLTIDLKSPSGVVSRLAAPRPHDKSKEGFSNWTFMSVAHWGEDGVGNWTLRVFNDQQPQVSAQLYDWTLKLWGQARDASKAKIYHLDEDMTLPDTPTSSVSSSHTTTSHRLGAPFRPVPTHHATTGVPPAPSPATTHETKPESSGPAPSASVSLPAAQSSSSSEEESSDGWTKLIPTFGLSKHTALWIWGSVLIIVIFIICVVTYIFVWRKRQQQRFKPIPSYDYDVEAPMAGHEHESDDEFGVDDDASYLEYHEELELQDYNQDRSSHQNDEATPSSGRKWAGKDARNLYAGEELFRVDSEEEEEEDITASGEKA